MGFRGEGALKNVWVCGIKRFSSSRGVFFLRFIF